MNEDEFQELLKYQNLLARQVFQEAKTDRKIKFLNLANGLTGNGKKKVQTASLIHQAEEVGFTEQDAYAFLEELERDGLMAEAGTGYVKRT